MKAFQTVHDHSQVRCFNDGHPLDGNVTDNGYAPRRGRYSQRCGVCGMFTFYDVEENESTE